MPSTVARNGAGRRRTNAGSNLRVRPACSWYGLCQFYEFMDFGVGGSANTEAGKLRGFSGPPRCCCVGDIPLHERGTAER